MEFAMRNVHKGTMQMPPHRHANSVLPYPAIAQAVYLALQRHQAAPANAQQTKYSKIQLALTPTQYSAFSHSTRARKPCVQIALTAMLTWQ
jgi:hypothetical protein